MNKQLYLCHVWVFKIIFLPNFYPILFKIPNCVLDTNVTKYTSLVSIWRFCEELCVSYCSIAEHFLRYFELTVANTPELKREVYRIRYKVYCEELKYESLEKFPDGLEQDDYDQHSIHYLLKHRPSGHYAGCVRVVLPKKQIEKPNFPLEKACPKGFFFSQRSRANFCEISRLAVLSKFRRQKPGKKGMEGMFFSYYRNQTNQPHKSFFPIIPLSLYWACIGTGPFLNLDVLALMEPRLARHFRHYGIVSQQIGDYINYRGKRGFFMIQPQNFYYNLKSDIREFFDLIDKERKKQLSKKIYKTGQSIGIDYLY